MLSKLNKHSNIVIVPTYNEKRKLSRVLRTIRQVYAGDILIVDDGSTDSTLSTIRNNHLTSTIKHKNNLGYGKALIDGFEYAIMMGYRYAITIDSDGQHDASLIPEMLKEICDEYDIISGSRYLQNSPILSSIPKDTSTIHQEVTNYLVSLLELDISDAFCGFKCYNVESLKKLNLTEWGYALPLQVWVQASKLKFKIKEFPVQLLYREEDISASKLFDKKMGGTDATIQYFKSFISNEFAKL